MTWHCFVRGPPVHGPVEVIPLEKKWGRRDPDEDRLVENSEGRKTATIPKEALLFLESF